MSPLIHLGVGWLIGRNLARRRDRIVVAALAVAPDLDGAGIVFGTRFYEEWHHKLAHGVLAAAVAVVVGFVFVRPRARGALLALLSFHSHVVMDLCGSGPGWPILYWWPFRDTEWLPSWQWDLASWQNGVFGLFVVVICLACGVLLDRTPVEIFSRRADAAVVATLHTRVAQLRRRP